MAEHLQRNEKEYRAPHPESSKILKPVEQESEEVKIKIAETVAKANGKA